MPNPRRKKEEEREQSIFSSSVIKPSQKFAEWYNAGAEENTLRNLAADAERARINDPVIRERNAWLRELAMQKAASGNTGNGNYDRRSIYTESNVSRLMSDSGQNQSQRTRKYYPYNPSNVSRMVPDGGDRAEARRAAGFNGPSYMGNRDLLNPVLEQMSREKAFRDMLADQNAVTGHEVIDQLLGLEQRTPAEEKPEHIQRIENLSAEEIKERQRSYNDKMTNDIDTAKRLLDITFAGQEADRSNAYVNSLRDSLGERWGFDAYDAEALQNFVDRAERGVIYTDSTGNETTWDRLYINARNREDAEANALTPEDQQELQRLYGMSSSELERQYRAQDENARTEDLNTAKNLLNYTNPWMEYDDPEVLKARQTLKDAYGIDPTDFDQLRNLIDELEQREQSDIIYTDSTGHNYTYQDLYYNAENREKFSEMRDDEGALALLTEGFRLSKQIDEYTADIADSGSAKNYTPLIQDAKQKMNIIADQLSRKGYDMDRLIGYLNTEQAKQDFLMQSQANKDFAKEHKVLAHLALLLATPVSALEWATNTTGSGNPEDLQNYVPPNYYSMEATGFMQDVPGATVQEIKDEMRLAGFDDKFVNLATSLYSGVLSAAQSRILALACTAAFGPVAGEAVSLAIMGSAAASEELRNGIDRGLDRQHAIVGALASGINEALFEKLSLEKFMGNVLDPANLPKTILGALKQSQLQRLVEGSEEVFTEIANMISDGLINGGQSDLQTKIRAYIDNGMSPDEAEREAGKEFLNNVLEAGFGGYIAGGGMGAFALNRASSSQFLQPVMGPMVDAYANYQQNRGFRNIGAGVVQNQNVAPLVQGAQQSGNQRLMDLANDIVRNPMYQQSEQVPVQNGQREAEKPTRKQTREYNAAVGKLASETIQNEANKAFGGNETALKEVIRSEMKSRNLAPQDYMVDVVAQVYNGEEENLSDYGKSVAKKINASEIAEHVRSNAADIEREANRISEESYERLRSVRSMTAADYSDRVSKTGEVIDTATGNAVEITEIANISKEKDGSYTMTFATKDGKRVNAADIQYADSTQAALYDAVRESGVNAEIGNAMVRAFDQKGTISAYNYVTGMLEGMQYGRTNQTAETASKNGFFADLTPSQKDLAIRFGRYESNEAIQEAVKRVNALKSVNNGTGRVGSVDVRSDMAGLNNAQRTGIRAIELLTESGALANNFHFFASEEGTVNGHKTRVLSEDLGGKKKGSVAPNGFYETKTGDIYIDLNAGNSGEGTILFTAAHELTHFVRQWSPQKFNDLADFVVQQLHGKGHDVDSLIRDQIRKSGSRNLSYEDAFEEMVADSMQTMFTDGDLMTKLLALKDRDRTLFDKLYDFIKNLQKGIRKVYGSLEPDSQEARYIREMGDAIDRIADMFAEGITEATENYSAAPDAKNLTADQLAELKKNGFTVQNGLVVAENMADVAAKVVKPGALDYYSYRTEPEWEKSVIAQFGDTPETRRYISAIKAFTNAMVADDAIRKIVPMGSYAYDKYGPLRDNVEYVITFDMDTSCPRTFQFLKYRDAIQAYAKRPLTYNESVNLLELMRAFGQNIPCSYCYVENKRVLLSASYNNFFAFRNNVLNEKDPNKAKKLMYGYNAKKKTLSDAAQKVFDRWRSDMSYNPTVQEIWRATQTARNSVFNFLDDENAKGNIKIKKSQKSIEELVCDHFGVKGQTPRAEISGIVSEWIYDTYAEREHVYLMPNDTDVSEVDVRALALNHEALAYSKSASSAKTVSSYVPYTDQLKNISKDVKDYVMGMGGIRKHSSNDFRIDYVQDYMMFYADLAAGGWTGHTYTKSTDFVKIFGRTGDRINMSIAMTDGPNGTVRENALEGMYWKDARALRKAYKNAGVMSMVTSDAQLSYALNSDWIDMIIPFHASSLDKNVWYNLRHWLDYTSKQLERFLSSKDMKLALIQKALDDAGVEYSSDDMKQKLIDVAREKGAGAKSEDTDKIKQAEITRLAKLAAKNGVRFNNKMNTKEIEAAYNSTFGVKVLYNDAGKRIKPHFLPGETVVDGVKIPGHNNDVNRYLELCREYGVHPRFDGVAVQDKNGNDINVIDHEGYIKLIKETARTDSEQEKIQFNLDEYDDYLKMTPMEYAMKQLEDYAKIGGYENLSEDPMGIKKRFIDEYLGKNRDIGWFSEETQDLIDLVNEYQNAENAGDDLPGYMDVKESSRGDGYVQPDDTGFLYSRRITDEETLGFLNSQKTVTVYRAMQDIDGKLYPPMTAYTRDENGKKVMRPAAEVGNWYQSVERPDLIDPKTGKFKLEKGETDAGKGSDVNAAYNPYFHTSLSILNDQFSSAWDRSNMVVVEGEVPVSELTSGYKAQYAKDAVGKTKWHSGPVATELNRIGKPREVILSRYFKPTRVIDNVEAAQSIADTLRGTKISIPENVVSPKLLAELRRLGVKVSAPRGLSQDQIDKHYNRVNGVKLSDRDSEGNTLTKAQRDFFKNSKVRDEDGNLRVVYHGTDADFTVFDRTRGRANMDIQGMFFSPWDIDAEGYGPNVKAYYLNITNPAPEGLAYKALNLYEGQNNAGVKAREYLEKRGYDGVNNVDEEYIAFYPEQIKLVENQRPTGDPDIRFSERDLDATGTRTLLSNALLDAAQSDTERKYIEDYQSKISSMNEEQRKLNDIRREIREMSFSPGKRDMDKLRSLREKANKLANRINIYDKQLLRIEAMKPMKAVVNRERTRVEANIREKMNARLTDYRNRVSSREYIARIQNEVKGLQTRLLHPKAKTVIPEAFARPVADFLSSIDFTTFYRDGTPRAGMANAKREQIRNSLTALAENLKNNEEHLFDEYNGLDISPDMQQWIKDTVAVFDRITESEGTFTVNQMSPEELKNLYKMLTAIRTAVNKAGKMYTNMNSNVMDLGIGTIEYLKPYIGKERSAVGTRVFKTLGWDYAQPVTAFSRFGDAGKQVYKGLLSGQKKEGENVRKILDFVDTAYTRKEVNDWQEELHTVHIGGMDYQIPVTYIMELYSMMKDKGAVQHITGGGGIRFDDLTFGRTGRKKTKTFANTLITEEEVDAMIAELTPRQKEVASNLQEFMDRVGAEWGNEISLTRFGYHAFGQIENYYPIRTIKGGSEYEAQQKRANIYALLNKSFTKERVENANNAVIIGDAFKTFSNHMSEMAVYNAWALPVIDTIKWFNYKEAQDLDAGTPERSVKDAIRMAYGAERSNPADEYIRRLLESINSQKSGGLSESLAFHNLRMVNRVAVSANIRVAVQQPFSITRAFELLNPKFVRPTTPKTRKAAYEEMLKYSSFGQWKDLGYYDVDISRPLEAEILKNSSVADRVTEKTMGLAERGDKFTWATLWHGCKLDAMSKGLTGEDASKAAAEKFDEIIAKTQVVDSVLTKSQWMRSDSFWHRMTSAFMSEPMTSYNTLLRRYDQFVRDAAEHGKQFALKRNGKAIAGTFAVFVLTQLVNALVTAPIDAARDDDDYKTWLEKMLEKFKKSALENLLPTGMMPYISDIVEYAIYGQEDRADIAMYTKLIDFAKQVHSLFTSEDSKQYKKNKAIMQGLSVFSNISGLPLSNMMRDAIAIYNTTVGDILKINHGALKFQTSADPNKVGYEQFIKAVKAENTNRMTYINGEMLENGIKQEAALNGVLNLLKTEYEEGADRGELTKDLDKVLTFFDAEDDAELTMAYWDYDAENPDQDERGMYNITSFRKYYNVVRPDGISLETYEQYLKETDGLKKKEEKMPVIDSLPITDAQKDSLYYLNGWSANTIDEAPWHGGSVAKPGQTEEPEEAVETSLGAKSYQWYTENAEPLGIELGDYEKYYAKREKAQNQDYDGDGKADVTKKEMIVKAIDEMPISKKQKDFLYLRDYSESGLKDTPWHKK